MTILGIGQSVYDILYPIHQFERNKKYRVNDSIQCVGGPVTCAMVLCAKWNAKTRICSRVGMDGFGKEIIEQLNGFDVDTTMIFMDPNDNTSISSILVDPIGNRTILNHPMKFKSSYPFDLKENYDVILFDGHEIDFSLKIFQNHGKAITIFDGDKFKKETMELIKNVDYLICSVEFAQEITQHPLDENTYKELREINKNHVVLTLGEKGCLFEGEIYPSYPCKVKDTTGAGDTFHGAFAYGLDQHWPIDQVISYASMASAICCEHIGGIPSLPSLEEVKKRLNQM